LKSADIKGLEPEDYDGSRWDARISSLEADSQSSELNLIHFDAELTVATMRYISDFYRGRVSSRSIHVALDLENEELDLSEFLRLKVINAPDIASAIAAIEPIFRSYRRTFTALQTHLELARTDIAFPLRPARRHASPPATFLIPIRRSERMKPSELNAWTRQSPSRICGVLFARIVCSLLAGFLPFQARESFPPQPASCRPPLAIGTRPRAQRQTRPS
jgi:hypothetical protein